MVPERDKRELSCWSCKCAIRNADGALKCVGMCKNWFLAKCVGKQRISNDCTTGWKNGAVPNVDQEHL